MEELARVRAVDTALAGLIMQETPVIVECCSGRQTGGGHCEEPSVPVKGLHRAKGQAFMRGGAGNGEAKWWIRWNTRPR
jgi:hypothetical protein